MIAQGRVENGVVVFANGAQMPEGMEVIVTSKRTHSNWEKTRSVLDIPTFSVGAVLKPLDSDDDLLEEMLEGRI